MSKLDQLRALRVRQMESQGVSQSHETPKVSRDETEEVSRLRRRIAELELENIEQRREIERLMALALPPKPLVVEEPMRVLGQSAKKPWELAGVSKATWYRQQKAKVQASSSGA